MSKPLSRWRTLWALFVRGFKTLLPLPEPKQEAWSYRAAVAPPKRKSAKTKSGKPAKRKTATKTARSTTTRKKTTPKQKSDGGRKSAPAKKTTTRRSRAQ